MKVLFLVALLVLGSMSFRIKQGNGFQQSIQETNAGIQELGQAVTDSLTAGQQAFGAATDQFNQLLQGAAGAMAGGNGGNGGAAAGRLQQGNGNGNGMNQALAGFQRVWTDLGTATQDFLESGEDAFDAGFDQTEQIVGNVANAGGNGGAAAGRLQQGNGNGFNQALQSLQNVWTELGRATNAALESAEQATDATFDQTEQVVDNVANAGGNGGAAGRLQQGNGYQQSLNQLNQVWAELGRAVTDGLDAGQQATDAAFDQTEQVVGNLANAGGNGGAAAGRLQQGNGNGWGQAMQTLQQVYADLAQATNDGLEAGQQATDATFDQTEQIVDNLSNAGGNGAAAAGNR
jgi:hypothetical protein